MPALNCVAVDAEGWPLLSPFEPVLQTISNVSLAVKWGDGYPTRSGEISMTGSAFLTSYRLIVVASKDTISPNHFSVTFPMTYLKVTEMKHCERTKIFHLRRDPIIVFTSTPMQNVVSFQNSGPAHVSTEGSIQNDRYSLLNYQQMNEYDRLSMANARSAPSTVDHVKHHIALPAVSTLKIDKDAEFVTRPGMSYRSFLDTSLEHFNQIIADEHKNQQVTHNDDDYSEASVHRQPLRQGDDSEASAAVSFVRAVRIAQALAASDNEAYVSNTPDIRMYGHAAAQHTLQNFDTYNFLCQVNKTEPDFEPERGTKIPSPEAQQAFQQKPVNTNGSSSSGSVPNSSSANALPETSTTDKQSTPLYEEFLIAEDKTTAISPTYDLENWTNDTNHGPTRRNNA